MKKIFMMIPFLCLLLGLAVPSHANKYTKIDSDTSSVGFHYTLPDQYNDLQGTIQILCHGTVNYDPLVYCADYLYSPVPESEYDAILQQFNDSPTEENMARIQKSWMYIASLICSDQDLENACRAIGIASLDAEKTFEAGRAGNLKFYYVAFPVDSVSALTYQNLASAYDPKYLAEADLLQTEFSEAFRKATYFAPISPLDKTIGKTLTFETKDLDGNIVKSEDLFRNNQITMVNIWGTWCPNCIGEFPELAQMHREWLTDGCGIVGIEYEKGWNDSVVQLARETLADYEIPFPSVIFPEHNEILDLVESFPTTFFVDQNGTVLSRPIEGAAIEQYRLVMNQLMSRQTLAQPMTLPIEKGSYRVIVTDDEGPVEEVTIQLCDDQSCSIKETDENGTAVFEKKAGVYEVHIIDVPEGYEETDEVFHTQSGPGEIRIHLNKLP